MKTPAPGGDPGRAVAVRTHTDTTALSPEKPARPDDLDALADRIRARLHRHTTDMVEIGADLIAAKEKLGHGSFGGWIESQFGLSPRSAQLYMRAAEWAEGKGEIVSHLPPAGLRLLSAPTTPEPIQHEVVEAIRDGAAVDFKEIEARIKSERLDARIEKRDQARRLQRSAASQKRRQREAEIAAAKAAKAAEERRLLLEEMAAILRRMPAVDLERLLQLNRKLPYASLADVLARACHEEAGQ